MANFVRLGIALVVVLVILVDSKSLKASKSNVAGGKTAASKTTVHKSTATKASGTKAVGSKAPSKKSSGKKNTGHKAAASQTTTQKPEVIEAPIQVAPAQNHAVQNVAAPAADPGIFVSLLNNPQVAGILAKLKSGDNVTAADMIPLMLIGMQAGLTTTNPALNSLSMTVNETFLALNASKDGKLTTGQMMIYSNRMLIALGNATDTPKENMSKLKVCMATGMRSYTNMDTQVVFLLLKNCSMYFGNGTKDGDAGVLKLLSIFLPPGIGDLVQNPVALGVMNAVSGIVSQVDMGGKDGGGVAAVAAAAAPVLIDSLDSLAKGAGLNFNFGQMFAGFGFGR